MSELNEENARNFGTAITDEVTRLVSKVIDASSLGQIINELRNCLLNASGGMFCIQSALEWMNLEVRQQMRSGGETVRFDDGDTTGANKVWSREADAHVRDSYIKTERTLARAAVLSLVAERAIDNLRQVREFLSSVQSSWQRPLKEILVEIQEGVARLDLSSTQSGLFQEWSNSENETVRDLEMWCVAFHASFGARGPDDDLVKGHANIDTPEEIASVTELLRRGSTRAILKVLLTAEAFDEARRLSGPKIISAWKGRILKATVIKSRSPQW